MIHFPPAYPLTEVMNWREYHALYESGKEQNVPGAWYPHREWDLRYFSSVRSGDVDDLRDFLSRQQKDNKVFLFKEPFPTTRWHVHLGHGDGSKIAWLVPVFDASSVSFFVNSVEVSVSVTSGAGTEGLPVASFSTSPELDSVVTFSYVNGYYCPMVFLKDVFMFSVQAPPEAGEIRFSLVEIKQDYPAV